MVPGGWKKPSAATSRKSVDACQSDPSSGLRHVKHQHDGLARWQPADSEANLHVVDALSLARCAAAEVRAGARRDERGILSAG